VSQVLAIAQTDLSTTLQYPICLTDFVHNNEPDKYSEMAIRYQTPVILFRLKGKKNTHLSYQDKCNRFPGLYQLVRSAFFRLQKLHALYAASANDALALPDESLLESYLEGAGYPLLQSANLRYVTLQNTQKKEKVNEMPLAGYVGETVYFGYFGKYVSLLKFMGELGVGNEVVYGMGKYEVEDAEDKR
jgi:hypothetical protein